MASVSLSPDWRRRLWPRPSQTGPGGFWGSWRNPPIPGVPAPLRPSRGRRPAATVKCPMHPCIFRVLDANCSPFQLLWIGSGFFYLVVVLVDCGRAAQSMLRRRSYRAVKSSRRRRKSCWTLFSDKVMALASAWSILFSRASFETSAPIVANPAAVLLNASQALFEVPVRVQLRRYQESLRPLWLGLVHRYSRALKAVHRALPKHRGRPCGRQDHRLPIHAGLYYSTYRGQFVLVLRQRRLFRHCVPGYSLVRTLSGHFQLPRSMLVGTSL